MKRAARPPNLRLLGRRAEATPIPQLVAKLARHDGISERAISCVLLQPAGERSTIDLINSIEHAQKRINRGLCEFLCSFRAAHGVIVGPSQWAGVQLKRLKTKTLGDTCFGFDQHTQCGIVWINEGPHALGVIMKNIKPVGSNFTSHGVAWVDNNYRFTGQTVYHSPPNETRGYIHAALFETLRKAVTSMTLGKHLLVSSPLFNQPGEPAVERLRRGERVAVFLEVINWLATRRGILVTMQADPADARGHTRVHCICRGIDWRVCEAVSTPGLSPITATD